jgi:IS5 family transposase
MNHPLVRLGQYIDWDCLAATLGGSYHPTQGAPGISTRRMVALHYLKYQADLSDEDVVFSLGGEPFLAALQRRALLPAQHAD